MTQKRLYKLKDLDGIIKVIDPEQLNSYSFYVRHSSQPESVKPKEITGVIKYILPDARMVHISDPNIKYTNGETVYVAHIVEIDFLTPRKINKFKIEKYIPNLDNPGEGTLEGHFL